MFEEGKNSDCLQHFYDRQSGRIQAVELKGFRLIAVTDAPSCPRSLVEQVERIAECAYKPQQLLLRAKELTPEDYAKLAREVLPLCQSYGIELIIHTHWQIALELGIQRVHLPLPKLFLLPVAARRSLVISSSVHSVAEARKALLEGAQALVAGHIYATHCKAGVPPRGLSFLHQVHEFAVKHTMPSQSQAKERAHAQDSIICQNTLPVYAIGGIGFDPRQWQELARSGAQGACIMSAYMKV